jgi:hypothetical protein
VSVCVGWWLGGGAWGGGEGCQGPGQGEGRSSSQLQHMVPLACWLH